MIAFFPGKFQPPHLGHILTIMSFYDQYDQIVIGITEDSPSLLTQDERCGIFTAIFKHLSKVSVMLLPGILIQYTKNDQLPDFDICLSGNKDVLSNMKKLNKKTLYIERSKGLGYSGTEIRELNNE